VQGEGLGAHHWRQVAKLVVQLRQLKGVDLHSGLVG
jgi:hypothetical protein